MNPFDLTGPEFLGVYVNVFLMVATVAAILRWSLRDPSDEAPELAEQLDPYDIAYLAGKEQLAVNAAMATLIQESVLQANASERKLYVTNIHYEPEHRLERAVLAAAGGELGRAIKDVREKVNPFAARPRKRLQESGLLVGDTTALAIQFWPTLLVLLVAGFGAIKVALGLSRDKPVLFLIVACVVTVLVAFIGFARKPHRTRRGDKLLKHLKVEHAALEYTANRQPANLAGADLAMAMGLFGMGVLAAGSLAHLRTALRPPRSSSECGGGCGSSGCGGGGGCGGGCGGGGCGGCGG